MILVSYVCAEFHDPAGEVLFTIRPNQLQLVIEVPESIRQDPLFDMLVREGTLQVPSNEEQKKVLENNPRSKLAEIDTIAAKKEETAAAAETAEKPSARKAAK